MLSKQVEELFEASSQLPEGERAAFLDTACGGDTNVRMAVEELLTAANGAEGYFSELSDKLGLRSVFDGDLELPRTETIGQYRLERLIARGGMGAVYLAERADEQFEKQVALKILPFGAGGDAAKRRFLAERQILARLVHPHIARLLDGGITDDGTPYFVMDFVDGAPIDAYCDSRHLDLDRRLDLFLDVADAVSYAHRNLVVHRDIKPGNVLVEASGDVKLVDFGVAKLLAPDAEDNVTRLGGRPMTLMYASPESIRGETATTAADVYSLGVLLYVLLTGRFPYPVDHESLTETQRIICEQDAVLGSRRILALPHEDAATTAANLGTAPKALAQRLAGDLDTIIAMALRKDPERRYKSVDQMVDDLRRYRDGLPVAARAPSLTYRMKKFLRRHKAGAAAAASIVVALLAVAGIATYSAVTTANQARQIAAERDKAEQINDFLLSIFELSSPNQTKGETVTAMELLERSADRVRGEIAGQPERQALLMYSIARVYSELSQFEKAKSLLTESIRLHEENGTDLSPDYASAVEKFAEIRELEGAFDEAEQGVRLAIDIRRLHADPQPLAVSLLMLGRVKHKTGVIDEAEAMYREGLDTWRAAGVAADGTVANGLSYLGTLLEHRGQLDEAESLQRESLAIRRSLYGDEHIIFVESYHNLGSVLMAQKKYEEARSSYEAALAVSNKLLPEPNPGSAFLYNGLGSLYDRTGELELSRQNYSQALELILQFFGDEHPNAGVVQGNLGRVLVRQGNFVEGTELLQSGVGTVEARIPNHRLLPRMRLYLGRGLAQQGAHGDAEQHLVSAYEAIVAANGPEHAYSQEAAMFLVELYESMDRPDAARTYRARLVDASN